MMNRALFLVHFEYAFVTGTYELNPRSAEAFSGENLSSIWIMEIPKFSQRSLVSV